MFKLTKIDNYNYKVRTQHYPYISNAKHTGHAVLLGIGGNIGDVVRRFEHLFWFLKRSKQVRIMQTSPILKNPPFGYMDQPYFYNALLLIDTKLTPMKLLRFILNTEKKFGRKRSFKNAPRTLDIDMIKYEKLIFNRPNLVLPHPFWNTRDSVLLPLSWMRGV
ncbi:MAG: 2-amino-4-hydroxy-6-hydroxymethyldihydropteridine diphosphokinase [Epsilonproteobacteria bacterium]|nr:2-amino-4-hydroxy-6-hydroxymethyldihydropteridine diphosphokinase [Campylobacterota bacterium]